MNNVKQNSKIIINDKIINLSKYKFFIFNLKNLKIETNTKIILGLAGLRKQIKKSSLQKFSENEIYKVKKPWGMSCGLTVNPPTILSKKFF